MKISECLVRVTVEVMGGKWKPLILLALKEKRRGFNELRAFIPEASHKVLTEQLRGLERMGVIERRPLERGRRAEYGFSEYGKTLRPVLQAMADWGQRHRQRQAGESYSGR